MEKILIIGLGNPGRKYKGTPHNAGFEVIDKLVAYMRENGYAVGESNTKEAAVYDIPIEGKKITLIKPLTYMNRSGEVVKGIMPDSSKPGDLWVIHDDIDLPIGALRIKKGGSAAGHKGVENIIQHIKTKDFYRFRIGVKPATMPDKRPPEVMSDFVTKKLKGDNKKTLEKINATCAELAVKAIEIEDVGLIAGDYSIE